jgi:hypothetical protein
LLATPCIHASQPRRKSPEMSVGVEDLESIQAEMSRGLS